MTIFCEWYKDKGRDTIPPQTFVVIYYNCTLITFNINGRDIWPIFRKTKHLFYGTRLKQLNRMSGFFA